MIAELFILSIFAPITDAGSYIVTFPDSLIPGVNLGARVTIIGATGPVQVVATLQYSQNNTHISTTSKTVTNGVPSTINIKVPEGLQSSKYKVSITGSGGLTFRNESDIHFEDKNLFIFVQTDKTRYSAGQKVRYRAILLHPNLLGFNGSFTITIYDGKDNKIEVTDYLKTKDGVVTGSLQLSREPVFGTWKIKISAPTESFTKQFDVNDYVLPRFRVEITLPTDLKMSATFLQIGITAKFTFNTDVFGNCTIQIYNKQNRHILKEYWKQIKGQVNFSIPMTDLKKKLSGWEDIVVRALVTDNATALTIAAEEDLKFTYTHQKTLSLTIPEARDTFVPGLTYHTKIFVGYDDEPIGTSGVINVTPEVTTAEIVQCLLNNPPTKWLDVKTQTLQNIILHFDESGYAALNFLVGAHTDRIVFQFSYTGIQRYFSVDSISSRPVDQLRMNVGRSHFRVGENVTLSSESTVLMNGEISYEIYARGILLKTVASGLVHTKHSSIDFEVTGDMVPQVYVVATYVTNSGVLLTDYVSIKVSGSPCKNKVSIKYNTTSLEPREGLKMDISADPNSTVYIMLEDEKNRLLGSENDIFFSEIEEKVATAVQNARSTRIRRQNVFEGIALLSNHHSIENHWQKKKQVSKRNYNAADNIYKNSGVVVLSNIDLVTKTDVSGLLMFDTTLPRKCVHLTTTTWAPGSSIYHIANPSQAIAMPGVQPGMMPPAYPGQIMQTTPAPVTVEAKEIIRNRFPETWLWEEYHIGPSGNLAVTKTAPDAITSWVSSVFATNPNTGFGISNVKQKIIVKKSFFLTMDLPTSVILGEEILVQITVFN